MSPGGYVWHCGVVQECGGQEAGEGQGSQYFRPETEYVVSSEDSGLQRSRGEEIIDRFFQVCNGVPATLGHCESLSATCLAL